MAYVYRKSTSNRRTGNTKCEKRGGYRAVYTDAQGRPVDEVIRLPNRERVYDKSVAQSELRRIVKSIERQSAGIEDPLIASAGTRIRIIIARFIRDLRNQGTSRKHVEQTVSCLKRLVDQGGIERLSEFKASNIVKALAKLDHEGLAPRTVNVYRRCAFALPVGIALCADGRNRRERFPGRLCTGDRQSVIYAVGLRDTRLLGSLPASVDRGREISACGHADRPFATLPAVDGGSVHSRRRTGLTRCLHSRRS